MSKASAEEFAKIGFKYLGVPYSEMDCQAFVERCMKDVGINMDLAGSNAWYRKMTWVGTPDECKKKFGSIPNGALLYIIKQDGKEPEKYRKDGVGNASHIGIKTGSGTVFAPLKGAIHSSSSKGCVCESEFRDKEINGGWNRIGLWDRFDYGEKINRMLNGEQPADEGGKPIMYFAVVKTDNGYGVNFRSEKSTSDKSYICKIPEGTELPVHDDDGTWSEVAYNNRNGYVMSKFLVPLNDITEDTVQIPRSKAEEMYYALKEALGL